MVPLHAAKQMAEVARVLRRRRSILPAGKLNDAFVAFLNRRLYSSESAAPYRDEAIYNANANDKWLALPPFAPSLDASSVGKALAGRAPEQYADPTTALKWVRRCCPHLPMSLVQKLFRLRQVRKYVSSSSMHAVANQIRRVAAKDAMMSGEVILLPATVQKNVTRKCDSSHNKVETDFIRSLELYKDTAILAINKPPGMAVQGGVRIKHSMDMIAARCLRYDFPEPPRLVHRLDRDSSGVLVLARTQECACLLHSLFREKTSGALTDVDSALQRKYLALVIGIPRHTKGTISAPLTKIVLGDGTSERITIANDKKCVSSQHALTEYKVISSSVHGYTWLELWPLTGRKHQLRVHCAEFLGTPIVGDYKYGRVAHRKWGPIQPSEPVLLGYKGTKQNLPFGLELDCGSICDKSPHLHLHCKQMVLPDVSLALQKMQSPSMDSDFSKVDKLNLVAPLPSHMQMSWDVLNSLS